MPRSAPLVRCGRQRRRFKCTAFGSLAFGIPRYCLQQDCARAEASGRCLLLYHCCRGAGSAVAWATVSLYNSRASAELGIRMPNCLSVEGSRRQLKARGGAGRTAQRINLQLGLQAVCSSSMLRIPGFSRSPTRLEAEAEGFLRCCPVPRWQ